MIAMELSINNFIQSCSHDSKGVVVSTNLYRAVLFGSNGVVYQQLYTELHCVIAMELCIENFIQSCTV